MRRDADFSPADIQKLCGRVLGVCSRPTCRKPTKGPHTDEERVRNFGKAAHIHAASKGGARFNESQSADERKSIGNGIWLCSNCATEIDNDEERFPADLLRQWKAEAEREADLRLEAGEPASVLGSLCETTNELLFWPQTLPDGTWVERPELANARKVLETEQEQPRPLVLLGPAGFRKVCPARETGCSPSCRWLERCRNQGGSAAQYHRVKERPQYRCRR